MQRKAYTEIINCTFPYFSSHPTFCIVLMRNKKIHPQSLLTKLPKKELCICLFICLSCMKQLVCGPVQQTEMWLHAENRFLVYGCRAIPSVLFIDRENIFAFLGNRDLPKEKEPATLLVVPATFVHRFYKMKTTVIFCLLSYATKPLQN